MLKTSFFCLFLVSCLSKPKTESLPNWILKPVESCPSQSICAVGSSLSFSGAMSDARNNMLKQFNTQITSNFTSQESQVNDKEMRYSSDAIDEYVNGISEGVEILNTHNLGKEYYAFAVLKKPFISQKIKSEILKIDTEMQNLIKKQFVNRKKLKNLYDIRFEINKQHLFVFGFLVPEAVKYNDIVNLKPNSDRYFIINSLDTIGVDGLLKNILLQNQSIIVESPSEAHKTIYIDTKIREKYLKIEGFKSFEVLLDINVKQNSKIIGSIHQTFSQSGRNKEDVSAEILKEIEKYLEENIDILNL